MGHNLPFTLMFHDAVVTVAGMHSAIGLASTVAYYLTQGTLPYIPASTLDCQFSQLIG